MLIVGLFTACDKDFDVINTNPNDPIVVPSGLLLTDIIAGAQNELNSTFTGGDMGSCWVQHIAKVQYNDEARYIPRESIIERVWQTYFEDVVCDSKVVQSLAAEEGNNNMRGVGLTLEAYGFGVLTDCYGDIPFSEACSAADGNFKPVYDSQEDVYTGIIALLDEAISAFNSGGGTINPSSDILFGGDASKWKKFANALKFRSLMRVSSKKDVASGLSEAISSGMFTSNDDEAKLAYLANDPNAHPWYETIVFGTRTEWKLNSSLVDRMEELSDPRLGVYCGANDDGIYRGKPSGIANVPNDDYNYQNVSPIGDFYLSPTLEGVFMSYSEQLFLMAEAAERGLISGDAESFFKEAITANFAWNGLDATTYLASSGTNYQASGDKIRTISEQKWIALFSQGVEAWIEWKRTGYPDLDMAIDAAPNLSSIPMRYTYPAGEQSLNPESLSQAIANQGPNTLDTKFWWLK